MPLLQDAGLLIGHRHPRAVLARLQRCTGQGGIEGGGGHNQAQAQGRRCQQTACTGLRHSSSVPLPKGLQCTGPTMKRRQPPTRREHVYPGKHSNTGRGGGGRKGGEALKDTHRHTLQQVRRAPCSMRTMSADRVRTLGCLPVRDLPISTCSVAMSLRSRAHTHKHTRVCEASAGASAQTHAEGQGGERAGETAWVDSDQYNRKRVAWLTRVSRACASE